MRDEYVGPDSGFFGGTNMPHNIPNPRRPQGARFDPVDPFGNDGFGDGQDFFGFNNMGQPMRRPPGSGGQGHQRFL